MTINEALKKAVYAYSNGEIQIAKKLLTKIIEIDPKQPDANHNMGVLLVNSNNLEESIPFFKAAVESDYSVVQHWLSYIEAHFKLGQYDNCAALLKIAKSKGCKEKNFEPIEIELNNRLVEREKSDEIDENTYLGHFAMGLSLQKSGSLAAAVESYRKSLFLKPNQAEVYGAMGVALAGQGMTQLAIDAYRKALKIKFNNPETLTNLGIALAEQGKMKQALEYCNKAIALKPDYDQAYMCKAGALTKENKLVDAMRAYRRALTLEPGLVKAHNNIGLILVLQSKHDDAIKAYEKALKINPNYAEALGNMGNALKEVGRLEEAIKAFKTALNIKPANARLFSDLGNALKEQGNVEEAIKAYKKALEIEPTFADAHLNLALALLQIGKLKRGLEEYEWRWKTNLLVSHKRHFSQPIWDGKSSLDGKRILVWCEQGIGDTINWLSCLPLIASKAKHCILECQDKLIPLLQRSFPSIEVRPENRNLDAKRQDFDFHLPMGSLYKHFVTKIPRDTNALLIPDPARVRYWQKRLQSIGNGPYVGISWKSSVISASRSKHYPPISEWSPVLTIPSVTFVNLQYVDFIEDLKNIKNTLNVTVHNFEDLDQFNNIDDTAALCAALDMVVSTKVTPPIISSAVGTLTKIANWRQSPWNNVLNNPINPNVDIVNRDTVEPWDTVFNLISEDLRKLTAKTTCPPKES